MKRLKNRIIYISFSTILISCSNNSPDTSNHIINGPLTCTDSASVSGIWKKAKVYFPRRKLNTYDVCEAFNSIVIELINNSQETHKLIIHPEGEQTEKTYFLLINNKDTIILSSREDDIKTIPSNETVLIHLNVSSISYINKKDYLNKINTVFNKNSKLLYFYTENKSLSDKTIIDKLEIYKHENFKVEVFDNFEYPKSIINLNLEYLLLFFLIQKTKHRFNIIIL